jgi:uncharacterized protein YbjQ (UPF0145 family)
MKKRGVLHIATLAGFVILGVLALACGSAPEVSEPVTGVIQQINFTGTNLSQGKDFTSLGMVFVSSTQVVNAKGEILEGSIVTYEMLLREAQKLGADDIVNLRMDITRKQVRRGTGRATEVTYTASVLAIKYK